MRAVAPNVFDCPVLIPPFIVDQLHQSAVGKLLGRILGPVIEGAERQRDHLAPPPDGTICGPVTIDQFSLSLTRCSCSVFFKEVDFHRQLPDLAFERSNLGFVIDQHGCFDIFAVQLAAVVLRKPQLTRFDDTMYFRRASLRPSAPDRMSRQSCSLNCALPTAGTSGCHGPSPV